MHIKINAQSHTGTSTNIVFNYAWNTFLCMVLLVLDVLQKPKWLIERNQSQINHAWGKHPTTGKTHTYTYIYIYTYTHKHTHTHTHTQKHAYTHIHKHTHTHTHIYIYTYTYKHTDTNAHKHRHIYKYTYIQTHTNIDIHIHTLHIHTHINTHTHTHTHTHTYTLTHGDVRKNNPGVMEPLAMLLSELYAASSHCFEIHWQFSTACKCV